MLCPTFCDNLSYLKQGFFDLEPCSTLLNLVQNVGHNIDISPQIEDFISIYEVLSLKYMD